MSSTDFQDRGYSFLPTATSLTTTAFYLQPTTFWQKKSLKGKNGFVTKFVNSIARQVIHSHTCGYNDPVNVKNTFIWHVWENEKISRDHGHIGRITSPGILTFSSLHQNIILSSKERMAPVADFLCTLWLCFFNRSCQCLVAIPGPPSSRGFSSK